MSTQHITQYRKDYRSPDYTISTIDLTFYLDDKQTRVIAVSKVKRVSTNADAVLQLDGEQLKLLRIDVDGKPVTPLSVTGAQLELSQLPAEFTLTVETEISPATNSALEGLYKSGGAFCTQCEAQGFRRITYYLDRPDVLATFTTTIIADKTLYPYLLANGNQVKQGDNNDGTHWVTWQDPYPKPCYLFALVAGQFERVTDSFVTRSGRKVALELFVDPGNGHRGAHAIESLKRAMAWDETRFDLEYDLDIYMVVAVDFFNMGAMENKGLNVFNSKFVLADPQTATDQDYLNIEAVIGHEYFHNWTGNRVTCRDWFQLSLKEGLTVFRDQEFSSDLGSRTVNRIKNVRVIRGPQFAEDAGPMAHPIRPDAVMEMNNFYTVTVYNKGSEVIRMLHTLLGEKRFMQGMANYLSQFDGQAATCEDFICAMEQASGEDLTQFRAWYSQAGTPELTVTDSFDPVNQTYQITVTQDNASTCDQSDKPPLHIPLDIELLSAQGQPMVLDSATLATHKVLNLTQQQQTFSFTDIAHQPIPALLREFSAPVIVDYAYSDTQLALLISSAQNEFIRWDAAQQLFRQAVAAQLAGDLPQAALSQDGLNAIKAVISNRELDPYFIAELLTLPTESELAQQYTQIDVDAIHYARHSLVKQLSFTFSDALRQCYLAFSNNQYQFDQASIGERALKNIALYYLAPNDEQTVKQHYYQADNMTDLLAALTAANQHNLHCLAELMTDFEARWQHEPLVMDKWFSLKASRPGVAADEIRSLFEHCAFSIENPNRVRALIGTFAAQNPQAFHQPDGSGYQLLFDVISQLNTLNPQVAARMIDPLLRFKRFDKLRQQLMFDVLTRLSQVDDLSRDLFEKISKALAS